MNVDKNSLLLYAVTDRMWTGKHNLPMQVEQAIKGGATFIQLREKDLDFDTFVKIGKEVKSVTERYHIPFVINDNIEVALAINADGVHIGQEDPKIRTVRYRLGADKIIGVSAHNRKEAMEAEKNGADYIGVGAVFHTTTKCDATTVSHETLKNICRSVNIPVVAIGGITKENMLELSGSGICGVAVISAIFAESDIMQSTSELLKLTKQIVISDCVKTILSIAGSDCSGGAGIQADIKTITAHDMYGMSVITALTAQNTKGVFGVFEVKPSFVAQQIDAVFTDIYPDAVKIGMVSNKVIISMIAEKLIEYEAKKIILDPVMISTSGSKLLNEDARELLITELIPMAFVITPNIPEAEYLSGLSIETKVDMQRAVIEISKKYDGNILIKGGHLKDCSDDLLYTGDQFYWFQQSKINNPNTHGTGCTLSSAIACNLAAGMNIRDSILAAKNYITGAIKANLNLGKGSGPLMHGWKKL